MEPIFISLHQLYLRQPWAKNFGFGLDKSLLPFSSGDVSKVHGRKIPRHSHFCVMERSAKTSPLGKSQQPRAFSEAHRLNSPWSVLDSGVLFEFENSGSG
jgi:hypothetical protein